MIINIEMLECHGIHAYKIRSIAQPRFARRLDGWTTLAEDLDPENPDREDLCPACSVRNLLSDLFEMLYGLPSCGWAMKNRNHPDAEKALFAWDFHPEGFNANDIENSMIDQGLAWRR